MRRFLCRRSSAALAAALGAVAVPGADACTRAVYFGKDGQVVTGRSMDWFRDMDTNLWAFPRGLKRDGAGGSNSLTWTSRHGSVAASVYEGGTADGLNERGLVANLLYLAESEYPPADGRPALCISAWAQYVLDNFATVAEAVADARKDAYRVATVKAPTGEAGTVHLSVSDATGDSAIFQYVGGKLTVHHGRQYQVMTNSPVYDKQLALNEYWRQIGGTVMLPGTNRAADRFARASFYVNACRQSADPREAVASVFSVVRNASVPRGISTPGQPNISSTIWRAVADQKNRVYYFENTNSPGLVWVRLDKLDLAAGTAARKLTLLGNPDLVGDQTANLRPAEPFRFLPADK